MIAGIKASAPNLAPTGGEYQQLALGEIFPQYSHE